MAAITRLDVRVITGNRPSAGTDGDIFVAVAGREFCLDSAVDDFERGADRTYILGVGAGAGSTINNPAYNDPRSPFALDTVDLDRFPMWIRFEPAGGSPNWDLEEVTVTVNPGPSQVQYRALGGGNHLWLGQDFGKYCFLKRV